MGITMRGAVTGARGTLMRGNGRGAFWGRRPTIPRRKPVVAVFTAPRAIPAASGDDDALSLSLSLSSLWGLLELELELELDLEVEEGPLLVVASATTVMVLFLSWCCLWFEKQSADPIRIYPTGWG